MPTKKQKIDALKDNGLFNESMSTKEINQAYNVLMFPSKETKEEETKEEETKEEETKEDTSDEVSFESLNELEEKIKEAKGFEQTKEKSKPLVERKRKKISKTNSDPDTFRINGYILLLVVDTVFPFAFTMIHNMFEKRFRIENNDISLNDKQQKELEPLANQAADYMQINVNPIAGFFITTGLMYGANMFAFRSSIIAELPRQTFKTKDK